MISVHEAENLIFQYINKTSHISINIESLRSEVLSEPLIADRDYPAFNRVAMDGIAISTASWNSGQRDFFIEGCQRAGEEQKVLNDKSHCIEVMTGATLPRGTNCVIRYEDIEITDHKAMVNSDTDISDMKNVHTKGLDYKQGDVLVKSNTMMSSPHWSIAASIGKSNLKVARRPKIAVVSTGDELVSVSEVPTDFQIRRSNVYSLLSSLRTYGFNDVVLMHLKDNVEDIHRELGNIISENDVVILSGGVSMGKFDFVPKCLADLKVKQIFHKVRQKPGKPLWFGVTEDQKSVFGLPGNPVSAAVCLHRYVIPSLLGSLGLAKDTVLNKSYAVLKERVLFKKELTYFLPVETFSSEDGALIACPIKSNGSGDFSSLNKSSGFLELPQNREVFEKGETFPIYFWRDLG